MTDPRVVLVPILVLLFATPSSAQLRPASGERVAMGHHHLVTADTAAQKRFWAEGLGATRTSLGTTPVYKLPNLLVLLRAGEPGGGMEGTSVPELSLRVRSLGEALERLERAGFRAGRGTGSPGRPGAVVLGPDGIRVALTEQPELDVPVANGSITLAGPDPVAMRDWYVRAFGASPLDGEEAGADLAGVRLHFVRSAGPAAGTQGRVLDHIGFEVSRLEEFARELEGSGVALDRPYRFVPNLPLGLVFLTDPWGTYIELTEGLARL